MLPPVELVHHGMMTIIIIHSLTTSCANAPLQTMVSNPAETQLSLLPF